MSDELRKEMYIGNVVKAWSEAVRLYKEGKLSKEFLLENKSTLLQELSENSEAWFIALEIKDLLYEDLRERAHYLERLARTNSRLWEVIYKLGFKVQPPETLLIKGNYWAWRVALRLNVKKKIVVRALKRSLTPWLFIRELLSKGIISDLDVEANLPFLFSKLEKQRRAWLILSKICKYINTDGVKERLEFFFYNFNCEIFKRLAECGIIDQEYRGYFLEQLIFNPEAWKCVKFAVEKNIVSKEEVSAFKEYLDYFSSIYQELKNLNLEV